MRKFDYINVVPLIDIMLVLLAIILTTSTFIVTGKIPVNLPEEQVKPSSSKQQQITLTITRSGKLFFNGTPISLKELNNKLHQYNKNSHINIKCDKNTYFRFFVAVIKRLQDNNFKNISIIVKALGEQ